MLSTAMFKGIRSQGLSKRMAEEGKVQRLFLTEVLLRTRGKRLAPYLCFCTEGDDIVRADTKVLD